MSEIIDGFQRGSAASIGPQIEALLAKGQQVTLQVSGDSMRPTLKPRRDAVVIEPLTEWPPKRWDILFYRSTRSASGYTLHRVRKLVPGGPIMNGDAQTWTEGPLAREQVLARAVMLIRNGKPLDIDKWSYRLYVRLWSVTRPARWIIFAGWRAIKKIFGK